MKANELMINDWVYSDVLNMPYQVGRPSDFRFMYTKAYDVFDENGEFKHLKPIPITQEILEYNKLTIGRTTLPDKPTPTVIDISKQAVFIDKNKMEVHYGLRIVHHEMRVADGGYLNIKFHYVHELQQMLRVIGLREIADGFKIPEGSEAQPQRTEQEGGSK